MSDLTGWKREIDNSFYGQLIQNEIWRPNCFPRCSLSSLAGWPGLSSVILATYVTFFIAEGLLHVSGVIALVSFGLTLTYIGKPRLNPEANRFMENFWGLAGYMANTLIFILVGVVNATGYTGVMANLPFILQIGRIVIRYSIVCLPAWNKRPGTSSFAPEK